MRPGLFELLVIAVVVFLVIRTEDLPGLARMLGRWYGEIRKFTADFRRYLDAAEQFDQHDGEASVSNPSDGIEASERSQNTEKTESPNNGAEGENK